MKKNSTVKHDPISQSAPNDPEQFYKELVTRNRHFVSSETQRRIRKLKVLVAGCGSGGGACIEPLARLGVTRFKIADSGAYELANLNRQHAFVDSIGTNKAVFHEGELKRINPFIEVDAYSSGITEDNLDSLVGWADLIFDCVDVTTYDAIMLKLAMHECSKKKQKPVFSMLDLGFCQWGHGFDYRDKSVQPLDGRLETARRYRNPIKIFMTMFPLSVFPAHSLQLIVDLLKDQKLPASQLGCASDLLSAVAAPSVIRFANTGELVKGWNIDLEHLASPLSERKKHRLKAPGLRKEIRRLIGEPEPAANDDLAA